MQTMRSIRTKRWSILLPSSITLNFISMKLRSVTGCTLCIAHWSIYLTSYCSMSVRCLLPVRLKRTLAENQKWPPLLAKTVVRIELSNFQPWSWLGYLACVLSATNWPCKQPVQGSLLVVLQCQARILLHRAECLWSFYNENLNWDWTLRVTQSKLSIAQSKHNFYCLHHRSWHKHINGCSNLRGWVTNFWQAECWRHKRLKLSRGRSGRRPRRTKLPLGQQRP